MCFVVRLEVSTYEDGALIPDTNTIDFHCRSIGMATNTIRSLMELAEHINGEVEIYIRREEEDSF